MTWQIGSDHALAQLAATLAFADAGGGPSVICLYTTVQPAAGAAPGGDAQAEITLAQPCGTIAGGVLTLHAADPAGALVTATGLPRWARWKRADGVLVGDGTVTDAANGGDLTVTGAATPPGETSPMLLAGGRALLGAVNLT